MILIFCNSVFPNGNQHQCLIFLLFIYEEKKLFYFEKTQLWHSVQLPNLGLVMFDSHIEYNL